MLIGEFIDNKAIFDSNELLRMTMSNITSLSP